MRFAGFLGLIAAALLGLAASCPIKLPITDCRTEGCAADRVCRNISSTPVVEVYLCVPGPTPTSTPSPTPTQSPTPPPSPSPTPTPVSTPSASPVPTPSPSANPSPTPTPSAIGPDGNYPRPPDGVCPAWFRDSFAWMGTAFRSRVPTPNPNSIGWRYNFDATPHSKPPYCGHAPGAKCEQWKPCQDTRGADFYMWLPGKFAGDRCDLASVDVGGDGFWCHHVPKPDETGPTTVCAVRVGDPRPEQWLAPNDAHCVTVDVHP